jgi:hypothetical protein
MANGKTGFRFENDIRDGEGDTEDSCRRDKAGQFTRFIAAILTTADGEKRSGYRPGKKVSTTHDTYPEKYE